MTEETPTSPQNINEQENGKTFSKQTVFIPERFKKAVTLHVIKNMIDLPDSTPLILGIHGPPGDGKTFQCEHILKKLRVKTFLISGGQLESGDAGEPAKLIRQTYLQAGEAIHNGTAMATALLINDFDTGVGEWGELVQYTINRQTVFGELMHLADYPKRVENKDTLRIPIIITGNNFTSLYEPLTRTGRMWSFKWELTIEEKYYIVNRIYPVLSENDVHNLVENYAKQPVAFFAFLKSALLDDSLWEKALQVDESNLIYDIRKSRNFNYSNVDYDLELLLSTADRVYNEGLLVNHLSTTENSICFVEGDK